MHKYILSFLLLAATVFAEDPAPAADLPLPEQAAAALEAGETKDAVKLYEKAIKASPDDAQLQTDYAQALGVRIGQVNFMAQGFIASKMLKAYERSVEIDPDHLTGWIGLCRYYLNAPAIAGGSADKAETYAKEVHQRVAWLGEVELGLVAEKRGDLDAAKTHFEAALAAKPGYPEATKALERIAAKSTE
ncbi:tetratricopeptide repeat protein [Actomonas aquatica]|uniref:Tetratricopeptide repeat protein n=1 Tax=Actomonas aquatica TaxID=2866162 RepID=A0ABZ1C5Z6_9BACT|nr:tetratricopeptide repeat protein [Opitutus sp. WL0086]WRQ87149.1 tetratricopeptide repeat protein [Opitutus sp. WL0086]